MKEYHDNIIEVFCDNLRYFELSLGFFVKNARRGISHSEGEIDILVEGFGIERALIEVKSNNGLMNKFLTKQYELYRKFDSNASIFLLMGTQDYSLNVKDFHFKRYHLGSW